MVVMLCYSVIIDLTPGVAVPQRPRDQGPHGCTVILRLMESRSSSPLQFALYDGAESFYVLTPDETSELLRLLGQIAFRAPWNAQVGRDGTTFTLQLFGPMSHAEFNWWGRIPSEWKSVGAVFDYVMSLARRCGYGPVLCA